LLGSIGPAVGHGCVAGIPRGQACVRGDHDHNGDDRDQRHGACHAERESICSFYGRLLPALGMTPVCDTDKLFYCVGARTAIGIQPVGSAYDGDRFVQTRVGLHRLCLRARSREDVDRLHDLLSTDWGHHNRATPTSSPRRAPLPSLLTNGRRTVATGSHWQ
jgi:hypothetical protein